MTKTEKDGRVVGKLIRVLPYVILLLAIWQMSNIHGDDEIDLASGLQALFLALAAIFLKLDIRDRQNPVPVVITEPKS